MSVPPWEPRPEPLVLVARPRPGRLGSGLGRERRGWETGDGRREMGDGGMGDGGWEMGDGEHGGEAPAPHPAEADT